MSSTSLNRTLLREFIESKTFREWADGEHCIYNHPHERNTVIADWFVEHLTR